MKIIFNNGKEVEILQQVAEVINERILNGAKQWQTFSEGDEVFLILNLDEVSCITTIKNRTVL